MNAVSPDDGRALNPVQLLFFVPEKPAEELYDLDTDPHEVRNLAGLSEYRTVLGRMRQALDEWQRTTGDLGLVPEVDLRERMRPGGVWARVATPAVSEARPRAGVLRLALSSETPGASFAYTTEPGDTPRWKLSTGAVELSVPVTVRIKACRLGYLDSDTVTRDYR
jgi:N-sulfoglucosamine sulfohydrolase